MLPSLLARIRLGIRLAAFVICHAETGETSRRWGLNHLITSVKMLLFPGKLWAKTVLIT